MPKKINTYVMKTMVSVKTYTRYIVIVLSMFSVSLLSGCSDQSTANNMTKSNSKLKPQDIDVLLEKKIFFGHQSVGDDLLAGLADLSKENPDLKLSIVNTTDKNSFESPVFAHTLIGTNEEPDTKSDAFKDIMLNKIQGEPDVAFFKYCFLDINRNTDVQAVFNEYKSTIEEVQESNPQVKIVHFTVPLMTVQTGPKAWLKKIIGKSIGGVDDNIKRYQYNQLVRSEFADNLVFDIANLESALPNGKKNFFVVDDRQYEALADEYTYDGGHLNEAGRKYIAERFIHFISNI